MAIFRGAIRSQALGMDTGLCVVLPHDRPPEDFTAPCRVLYLLHGLGENCEAWTRYTAVERYARQKGIALVMPEVQRSFYLDMKLGPSCFTYVAQELPELCRKMFHLSARREDTFIAGLSMGGYGAMRCGLGCPEQYAGCASFSGAVDIRRVVDTLAETEAEKGQLQAGLGWELMVEESMDLYALAKHTAALPAGKKPRIFITCGQQDFLYSDNTAFRDHLQSLQLEHAYHEWPGEHEWGFWDKSVQMALDFFLP